MKNQEDKRNQNRVIGQLLAGVVKRLKSSGLPPDVVEKAVAAARGQSVKEGDLQVPTKVRKLLFGIVQATGPLVLTGRKALKIYTLSGYTKKLVSSRASANKHKPWLHVKSKKISTHHEVANPNAA